jgi:hypothetical protein
MTSPLWWPEWDSAGSEHLNAAGYPISWAASTDSIPDGPVRFAIPAPSI